MKNPRKGDNDELFRSRVSCIGIVYKQDEPVYILAGISRLPLAHIDTPRRDLHNVYYANLSQRACINKCYIIIQIKCFNLHTFYRPLSRHAECTRSTRGARRVRAASHTRTRERAALREREREGASFNDGEGRGRTGT